MRNFSWLLNPILRGLSVNNSDVIVVWYNGRRIGNCTIDYNDERTIGNFRLNEDLVNNNYIVFAIGNNSINQVPNECWLEGIVINDLGLNHEIGLENIITI